MGLTSMTLHPELQKAMALTNADRQCILDRVQGLTQSQIDYRLTPKAWSVGEVLHHLIRIEVSISKLFNKLIKEHQRVIGVSDVMRLEDMTYGADRPQQAPEFGIPAHGRPFGDLLTDLAATRERTTQTLAKYTGDKPSELRWTHQRFGDMGMAHWVRFIGLHEGHHLRQIERIMALPGFPG
jgi:DinB superfamily